MVEESIDKQTEIVFHYNKKHNENPSVPPWVIKVKGQTYYVHHIDVSKNVGFSTKETPNNSHTKGSLKFKGNFKLVVEDGLIIGKIF